jgi:hypothetical protein
MALRTPAPDQPIGKAAPRVRYANGADAHLSFGKRREPCSL